MSTNTTQAEPHVPASFEFLPRRRDDHSSSTHISPGSSSTHTKNLKPRPFKPPFHTRSRSDQPVVQRKVTIVPAIGQTPTVPRQVSPISLASSKASISSLTRKVSTVTRSSHNFHPAPTPLSIAKPSRPGFNWHRTRSGGVWFVRPTSGTGREFQRTLHPYASASSFFRPRRVVTPTVPEPLRQTFTRPDGSVVPGRHHSVKLETSFTDSTEPAPVPQTAPKRRLSLNPKQFFSNTVLLARRFSFRGSSSKPGKETTKPLTEDSSHNLSPVQNLNHSTALRRNKTASVLQHVTSILSDSQAQQPHQSFAVPKIFLNKSNLSPQSPGTGVTRSPTQLVTSGAPTMRTPPVSYTSSQRQLRLGVVPAGTPEDYATYRVGDKIYFKVDISIRGGTSYLPSEARRVHTPPLPGEELHVQGPMGPDGHRFVKMRPRMEGLNYLVVPKPPKMERALTRDWYDVQLALLESEARPALLDDVPVDYDIPEHLPSSPLCPKNDRYWRFVQGKLKAGEEKHRVCWMHGMRCESPQGSTSEDK